MHELLDAASRPATWVDLVRARATKQPAGRAFTFLVDGESQVIEWTYGELDRRARSIASHLQSLDASGQPVLLLYRPGLEFVAAFLGCLYAGAIAVPLDPPRPRRSLLRWKRVFQDSQAHIVLTEEAVRPVCHQQTETGFDLQSLTWVVTPQLSDSAADDWSPPAIDGNSLAFLQYTSGSTGHPKGVMVSHGNLLRNTETIQRAFVQTEDSTLVGWLPLFHDMGLIGVVLQSLMVGSHCVLMAPEAFLIQPFRWLQAISRYRAHTSGGPNFAYDLCTARITAEQRSQLDLSCWKVAFNGAEPVRHATLEKFATMLEPSGFSRTALYPCYGLAEATLFVSGGKAGESPKTFWADRDQLQREGRGVLAAASSKSRPLVSCGRASGSQHLVVVDPHTSIACPPGTVGEIWVGGASVAQGYWHQAVETEKTFRATRADTGEGPYLRTGDLGLLLDGELYVTGRLKDLVICNGRKHFAEDLEHTVEHCHAAIRPGCCAAFSVDGSSAEHLIIVAELDRHVRSQVSQASVTFAIRDAVADRHDLRVEQIILLRPGTIPKTSSGKVQRHACRAAYLRGSWNLIEPNHDPQNSRTITNADGRGIRQGVSATLGAG